LEKIGNLYRRIKEVTKKVSCSDVPGLQSPGLSPPELALVAKAGPTAKVYGVMAAQNYHVGPGKQARTWEDATTPPLSFFYRVLHAEILLYMTYMYIWTY
jgi:hypothetical protein